MLNIISAFCTPALISFLPICLSFFFFCCCKIIPSSTSNHRCVGSCSPTRKALISFSPSAGLLRGTRWPAPLTVTMLMPWYSTNLPATCIFQLHISASLATADAQLSMYVHKMFRPACQGTRAAMVSSSVGRALPRSTGSQSPVPYHPRRRCIRKKESC